MWKNFCNLIGREDLCDHPKFATNPLRTQHRKDLEQILIPEFKKKTRKEWLELLGKAGLPHSPANVKPARECGDIAIDQVVIGSCTNGWIEDMRSAAAVIKGRKVAPGVRMIVIPATQDIYRQCMMEGLTEIFVDAGAAVSTPTCGPCLGGYMGILAQGERAVSTTNRNFLGRMGHPQSEVYLANPAIAAASAVLGRLGGPDELGIV